MTKPSDKAGPQPKSTAKPHDDLQTAYQCHTLAQLVYGQLAAAYPWLVQPPFQAPPPPRSWQQPWPGARL